MAFLRTFLRKIGHIVNYVLISSALFCTINVGNAHTLHVGTDTATLSTAKRTTPSLNIATGNEHLYLNLNKCDTPINRTTSKRLIIQNLGNKWENYHASDFMPSDADYVIIDGNLVWANCDIYLDSMGGTAYIKTTYKANPNTRMWVDFQFNSTATQQYIVGNFASNGTMCFLLYSSDSGWGECSYDNSQSAGHRSSVAIDKNRHQVVISADKHVEYFPGVTFPSLSNVSSTTTATYPMGIFGNYQGNKNADAKLYGLKIWDNNILVHKFVPVPAGLQIGNFTVPSNGLFDIVEQQFYGANGPGYFGIGGFSDYDFSYNYTDLYTYDSNGRLVDADSRVSLEAGGTQYINTTYTANPNTKIFIDYKMNSTNAQQYIFGRWTQNGKLGFCAYINGSGTSGKWAELSYNNSSGSGHATTTNADTSRHQLTLSAQNHIESWTGVSYTNVSTASTQNGPGPIGIFSNYNGGKNSKMILWRFKIWESNVLVHDFVPVPIGLQIGNFTVPSNGLFDIVAYSY